MSTKTPPAPRRVETLPYRPCVGIVLANPDGMIFAAQRIDSEFAAWQMPQGGIDPHEDALTAAKRELEEETGIGGRVIAVEAEYPHWLTYDLPGELIPQLWGGRFRGQRQKWFLFRFLGHDSDVNIETVNPEFSNWKWLSPEAVIGNAVSFKSDVYRQVIGAFLQRIKPVQDSEAHR